MDQLLKNIPLFSGLNSTEINSLAKQGVIKHYPKNTILINEGDNTSQLYVILEGKVKVFVGDAKGREIILSVQGAGEYFGEISLIDDQPRSASVMTKEASKCLIITKQNFDECLLKHPGIAIKLLKAEIKRVRRLTDNVKNLVLMDVYGRVARTLLNMASEQDEGLIIDHKLTHTDIARMVGASREMVSRIMKDLSDDGYIINQGNRITINQQLPNSW